MRKARRGVPENKGRGGKSSDSPVARLARAPGGDERCRGRGRGSQSPYPRRGARFCSFLQIAHPNPSLPVNLPAERVVRDQEGGGWFGCGYVEGPFFGANLASRRGVARKKFAAPRKRCLPLAAAAPATERQMPNASSRCRAGGDGETHRDCMHTDGLRRKQQRPRFLRPLLCPLDSRRLMLIDGRCYRCLAVVARY